jgi:hypothetical protein
MQRVMGHLARVAGSVGAAIALLAAPAWADEATSKADSLLVGLVRGPFTEAVNPASNPENLNSQLSAVERYYLHWDWAWSAGGRLGLQLHRGSYAIADQDFPGTVHQRTETDLQVGGLWRMGLFGGEADLGPGYQLQYLQIDNTATAPGTDPRFLFAPWQLYHGPALIETFRRDLVGPLGIALDVAWVPYVFANMADNREALPWLTSVRVAPRFVFWDERVALGYYYERLTGTGFNREASGLLASISLTGI